MGKRQNAFLLLHNFYSLSVFLLFLLLEFLEWYISDENHIICNYSFTFIYTNKACCALAACSPKIHKSKTVYNSFYAGNRIFQQNQNYGRWMSAAESFSSVKFIVEDHCQLINAG